MFDVASVSAGAIEAAASVGTVIIALFVLFQATRIRRAEGIFRQNQAWNEFGNAVAELHHGSRAGELLMGKDIAGASRAADVGVSLTPKEAFLLMSFFNVVSSEYNGVRARVIDREYVVHSLTMTANIVKRNKTWIFTFLKDYGYEESFRRVVAIAALTSDELPKRRAIIRRELLAMSVWGTICGSKFRAWLRKHLDESQVQALCGGDPESIAEFFGAD